MADKRDAEEEHCTTPRGALPRQPKRRKIVTTSPLSDTARRLLLVKCSAADQQEMTASSSSASSVTAPRATDSMLHPTTAPITLDHSFVLQSPPASQPTPPVIRDMVIDQYPQLHVEEGTNSEWLVISRLDIEF